MIRALSKKSHCDRIYVRCPRGHPFATEIYTTIDITEGGDVLETLVRDGVHSARCPTCGEICPIAEPLTIHDSTVKVCALYIPAALSHWELVARAEWLIKLAGANKSEIPAYFEDVEIIVGRLALAKWSTENISQVDKDLHSAHRQQKASSQGDNATASLETRPPIHEAFADLLLSDSKPPSVPPESDLDEADDWLDGFDLASPAGVEPPRSMNLGFPPDADSEKKDASDAAIAIDPVSDHEKKHQ